MPAFRRLVIAFLSVALFVACSDDDAPEPVGLMWGIGASGAFVGDTISLVVFYRDAMGDPIGMPRPDVTWTTSRPDILSIVSDSLAVALDVGQAILTATTTTGASYTLPLRFEVIPPWQGRLVWVGNAPGGQAALFVRNLPGGEIRRIPEFAYPGNSHGDPYLSRDGSKVAAIATRPIAPLAPSTIYIVNLADSTTTAPFDALPGYQIAPVWMPGDTLLAFLMNTATGWEVFTGRPDGTGVVQRTQFGQFVPPFFDVTPDGHLVLPLRPATDLFEVTLAGDTVRRLTSGPGEEEFPTVSPDGRMIAFNGYVRVMNRDGTNLRELLPRRRIPLSPGNSVPASGTPWSWTPDSRFILVGWQDPQWIGVGYLAQLQVYAIRVTDGLAIRLERSGRGGGDPSFR
jgi:Tol biopolymer transport system component